MSRTRAAWIAAGLVVLAAVAFLVRRRRALPVSVTSPSVPPVTAAPAAPAAPVEGISTNEVVVTETWQRFQEASSVPGEEAAVVETEQPLATWVRVAIVVVALLAFFAVSLVATKQV